MISPTAKTLERLRNEGWTAQVTERFNVYAKVRQDLFGFCDVLAIHPQWGTLAIQATSATNFSGRRKKVCQEPRARLFLLAGRGHHRVEVWGWTKPNIRKGGKRRFWKLRRESVQLEEIAEAAVEDKENR